MIFILVYPYMVMVVCVFTIHKLRSNFFVDLVNFIEWSDGKCVSCQLIILSVLSLIFMEYFQSKSK